MKQYLRSLIEFSTLVSVPIQRFTLPALCFIAATVLSIMEIHDHPLWQSEHFERWLSTAIFGGLVATSINLFGESRQFSIATRLLSALISILAVGLLVTQVLDPSDVGDVFLLMLLSLSLLIIAPYLRKTADNDAIWTFNSRGFETIAFGLLGAIVLAIGGNVTLASINYLFALDIHGRFFADLTVIAFTLYLPSYVLANIPKQFDLDEGAHCFPPALKFIAAYLLLPLMAIYLLVLYAYIGKIVIEQALPKGNLSTMICLFGVLGVTTKLIVYPLRNSGIRLLDWFDRYFFHSMIIPIIALAFAIYTRIEQYGLTEQRYLVVIAGVWLAIVTAAWVLKKEKLALTVPSALLACLTLIAMIGPLSAERLSTRSQLSRLEAALIQYRLLQQGQIHPDDGSLSFAKTQSISSQVAYLCGKHARFLALKQWLQPISEVYLSDFSDKKCQNEVLAPFGLKFISRWELENKTKTLSIVPQQDEQIPPLPIGNYNYLVDLGQIFDLNTLSGKKIDLPSENGPQTFILQWANNKLTLMTTTGQSLAVDFEAPLQQITHQAEPLILNATDNGTGLSMQVMIQTLGGTQQDDGKITIGSARLMLLFGA